jgi:uncharacterized protein HemX
MKMLIVTVAALVLALAVGFASYLVGHDQGYSQGHRVGNSASQADSHAAWERSLAGRYMTEVINEKYPKLQQDYNALVSDYNQLREAAMQYVGATQYQARQPIYCTSTAYGIDNQFSSTSCY